MARTPRAKGDVVKTTVDMPEAVWRQVRIRAAEERTDLRTIVLRALALYLGQKEDKR